MRANPERHLKMSTTALTTLARLVVEPLLPRGWSWSFTNDRMDGRRRVVRLEIEPASRQTGTISVLPDRRIVLLHPSGTWRAGPYKGPSWSGDLRLALANTIRILRDLNDIEDAGEQEGSPPLLVVIESPFSARTRDGFERNVLFARAAMFDSLMRGEAPIASHLLYTQVLNDDDPAHRERGIEAGLAWVQLGTLTAVYVNLGVSDGMTTGMERACREGRIVACRQLPGWKESTTLAEARELLSSVISPSVPFDGKGSS